MIRRIDIPNIEIGDELGHGAHSIVYRARLDGSPCAVKVPRTRGRWTRWVYREAVALARVRHPSLPVVLEVGEADGLPYLVMELVEGETLADRLARSELGEREALELAVDLAEALAAVHDAGLVHRDVKPRNIIIERGGRIRLVDFGFAAPIHPSSMGIDAAGTPGYSAPEQFKTPSRVDGRADLYALGRVLSVCLQESAERFAAPLPVAIGSVIDALLASDPNDRYPDARSLASDLLALRDGEEARGPRAYAAVRYSPPLIGRESELRKVAAALKEIGPSGGAVTIVRGGRGTGKTHLLSAAAIKARSVYPDAFMIEIRCRDGDVPLAALQRVFETFIGLTAEGSVARAEHEDALRAASADHLESFATLIAPALTTLLGDGAAPPATAEAFVEGAAEILVRLARRLGRLFIVIDDFQWVDSVSRDVLVRLAHRIVESPILLMIGTRDDAPIVSSSPALPQARIIEIELRTLRDAQVGALVASHLGEPITDGALVRRIAAMAGGTPLGVLEVLGAFLDVGAVRPQARSWMFDVDRADRVVLPAGALALLGHRVAELPPATRRVLEAAAILGTTFDDALLARVMTLAPSDLEFALADGRQAGLIEQEEKDAHRFVHDSLREMLVGELDAAARRALHQQVAETLDAEGNTTVEALCACALHFAAGEWTKAPAKALRVSRAAAEAALERFDNAMAIRFFALAASAAEQSDIKLDASFYRNLGEAQLRVGALDESLQSLERALERSGQSEARAILLGRIAWVYQTRAEPESAWSSLSRAFAVLHTSMPIDTATSAAKTVRQLAVTQLARVRASGKPSPDDARRVDLLCALHYQNARLGMEYGKPFRLVQSALQARRLSAPLGASRAQARAGAIYGVVLTALGRHASGARELESAKAMASRLMDPVTATFCLQLQAMGAGWAGSFDRSLVLMRECLDNHGHWLELNEYCYNAASADFMEALRGRPTEAWAFIGRAIERLRRSQQKTTVVGAFVIHRARAALASLGRRIGEDPWLANQYDAISKQEGAPRGFYHLVSWGPRARFLVESGDVGPAFDTLVREFESEGHNARSVHIMVAEYYVAVVHGRIHQCLRAPASRRAACAEALRRAVTDLRAAAKIPLLKAHRLLGEGHLLWLEGSPSKAMRVFAEAEAIADQESCSWVLYGIARARAHMLLEQGRADAARDQARVAEMLALAHGAEPRARWIRDELGLPSPAPPPRPSVRSSGSSASHRARRQLASLLHVVGAPHPGVHASQHATTILDNLLRDLDAESGLLWFQPDTTASAGVLLGRNRAGETTAEARGWREPLIRSVRTRGQAWPPDGDASASLRGMDPTIDVPRVLVFPLFLYDDAVGAVCLERNPANAPFSVDDRELLDLVSHQIPIALEIARLLAERTQLQASLQQVQKMDAVAELAGGVAHDFNNMLMVVKASLDTLGGHTDLANDVTEELGVISQAADRAAQLTRRLLSFSRHQAASRSAVEVNGLLAELEPILHRVVSERVKVSVVPGPTVESVQTDRAGLEQALVNLTVNARDAMPDGGTITITTSEVVLKEEALLPGAPVGDYVLIEVADSGHGMSPEILSRVFDPFFTTKPSGGGTGLGLTMVYAFAKNSGGHVGIESEVGRGTTVKLYLPRSRATSMSPIPPPIAKPTRKVYRDDMAILVVDDDRFVRESVRRVLHRAGYRVLIAGGADEALEIVGRVGPQIALAVLDVMMPGMTGPELARRLVDLQTPAKVLFISGFAPGNLPVGVGEVTNEMLLQKPFAGAELLQRVSQLVEF